MMEYDREGEHVSRRDGQRQSLPMPRQVRHNLRTYLGQIIGYSEMLGDTVAENGPAEMESDLQRIHQAGHHLLHLVNTYVDPLASRSGNITVALSHPTERPSPTSAEGDRPVKSAGGAQGTLLLVDDNPGNRDLLARYLQPHGYTLVTAGDGTQALQWLETHPCDLILLDILMPDMDGYEVLQQLKADQRLRHIPVIMSSALDELDSVVRCIQLGAEDYLFKPFEPVLLQARVVACLEKKRLRDHEQRMLAELQGNYQRLKELESLRDDLTHMIIHDLRTPLTAIQTGLQTLEVMSTLPPESAELLEMALDGSQTLLGMINDLLDISKMEAGSGPLETGEVQIPALAEQAMRQVAALARDKGLTLQCEIEESLPIVQADGEKLRRTLVNLLGNAIKFTPTGGSITLSVRPIDGAALCFAIRDTGEGIPEEAFARIFEKFGQVESRKAGRKLSTGLGLTFCKMAVEAHGGRIWVESAPGQGSTFSFTIPLSRP